MLLEMRHTRHPDVEIDAAAREKIPQIRNAPRIRGIPLAVLPPPDKTLLTQAGLRHACMHRYMLTQQWVLQGGPLRSESRVHIESL